jgi:hypothetical protein
MEALGGAAEARTLITSKDVPTRASALQLMLLFASDQQLAPLTAVVLEDPEASLRRSALNVLRQQKRTPKWEQAVAGVLAASDDATRAAAITLLIEYNRPASRKDLQDHLAIEKTPELRAKIQTALASPPPH